MPTAKSARHAIRPRVYLRADAALGPGKIDVLKHVDAEKSNSRRSGH